MDLEDSFKEAIRGSLKYLGHPNKDRTDDKYYDEQYAEPIRKYFKDKGVTSYELTYNSRYKCSSICAHASSGRLCYLYFKPKNAEFEKPLYNDLSNSRPTKMDAVIGKVNYECKCQEILNKSHTSLREKYLESKLFNEFKIKKYDIFPKEETNKETKQKEFVHYLSFKVDQLNIKIDGNPDYSKLHFDLKQLICHLIAIANNNEHKDAKLQYVFFTPSKEQIKKYERVDNLYKELNNEITAIFAASSSISIFAKEHKIKILETKFVPIDSEEVEDFVYKQAFIN